MAHAIEIPRHESYGPLDEVAVRGMDFAKAAAEYLIDTNGHLRRDRIASLVNDVHHNPAARLATHHAEHVLRTLARLEHDDALRAVVESACEDPDCHPRGKAADMVRATLNLGPLDPIGKVEARKAILMTLLADLRQDRSAGSGATTAIAITLLKECPEQVTRELKSLLERNQLVFHDETSDIAVPINANIQHIEARAKLELSTNGQRLRKKYLGESDTYRWGDTPGGSAVSRALGIPEDRMHDEVEKALKKLRASDRPARYVTSQQIIALLVVGAERDPADARTSGQRMRAALDAFAGRNTVCLLRAWENTLAIAAEMRTDAVDNDPGVPRANAADLGAYYGSTRYVESVFPKDNDEEVLKNLFSALHDLAPKPREKTVRNGSDFTLRVEVGGDTLSLFASRMKETWRDGMTTQEWINETLVQPANEFFKTPRTKPSLVNVLRDLGPAGMFTDNEQISEMQGYGMASKAQRKSELEKGQRSFDKLEKVKSAIMRTLSSNARRKSELEKLSYTLEDVKQAIMDMRVAHPRMAELCDKGLAQLAIKFPPPAFLIADTHFAAEGEAQYIGVFYNPFTEVVQFARMNPSGGNRFLGWKWPEGPGKVYAPLMPDVSV